LPQNYTNSGGSVNGKRTLRPSQKRFLFNVDTLWYTFDAENYGSVMSDGLLERLKEGKLIAEERKTKNYLTVRLKRYENPITFEIQAYGQAPIYAFCIRNEDIAIYLARQRRGDETYPIKVQINQFKLWEMGMKDAYAESLKVLNKMGFICTGAKPSRMDLCVHSDQFQWHFNDFEMFTYPQNFSKDNRPDFVKLCPKTGVFETVYFGDRSRLQLRIYDKSKEIKAKGKEYFRDLYIKHGMDPDKVWNVEFEVRRDYLKNFMNKETGEIGVFDSMENLLNKNLLSMLWTDLVTKFTHDSAFWKVLQRGDPNKFIKCKNYLFRLKEIDVTKIREVAQIRGRLKKFVLSKDLPSDKNMLLEAIDEFLIMVDEYEYVREKNFEKEVYEERKRYMDIEMSKLSLHNKRESYIENVKKSASQNDTDR